MVCQHLGCLSAKWPLWKLSLDFECKTGNEYSCQDKKNTMTGNKLVLLGVIRELE